MKRYIAILFLLTAIHTHGQTVHTVQVAIGQGDDCPVVTSIPSITNIQVFPNPATSTLSIQSAIQNATFRLVNVDGKIIKRVQKLNTQSILDLNGVPKGIYILQVKNSNEMQAMKIIVQ